MTTYNPEFLVKNVVTSVSQISDSAGTANKNKQKLFDRNFELQYGGIGETAGTRTITWTPSSSTSINRIFIQNHNFAAFTIKYNTSSDFSTAISISGNTDTNHYFRFNSQAVTNVVISVTSTITAGDVIKLGQLYIGETLFTMSDIAGAPLRITPKTIQKLTQLSDGTVDKTYVRTIFNYDIQLSMVSTDRSNYISIFNRNRIEPIVFIPYPKTTPDVWDGLGGHYQIITPPDFYNFTEDLELNDYDIRVGLSQAGGL